MKHAARTAALFSVFFGLMGLAPLPVASATGVQDKDIAQMTDLSGVKEEANLQDAPDGMQDAPPVLTLKIGRAHV